MSRPRVLAIGAAMATLTGEALRRVQRNYTQHGAVPAATSTLVWALYLSHWAATILAVRRTADTLPPPARPTRLVAGGLAGAGVAVAGVGTFASLAHMSGTSNEGLVTAGIYRHSRNPQNHGLDLMPRDVRLHRAGATAPGSARPGAVGRLDAVPARAYGDLVAQRSRRAGEPSRAGPATGRRLGQSYIASLIPRRMSQTLTG